jgi:hypothetical protein
MFTTRLRRHEGYDPVRGRSSSESPTRLIFDDGENIFSEKPQRYSVLGSCLSWLRIRGRLSRASRWRRTVTRFLYIACTVLVALLIIIPIFAPSYSRRPSHYRGSNPNNERVFIAANIVDKDLIRGTWGKSLVHLIDIIGHENVFLSIYENDSGPDTRKALQELAAKVKSTLKKSQPSWHC